jgi:uncharacterized protein
MRGQQESVHEPREPHEPEVGLHGAAKRLASFVWFAWFVDHLNGAFGRPIIRRPAAATFSRKGRRVAGIAALLLMLPALALAQPKFPQLTGRVVDDANLLSPSAQQELTTELAALEQTTGHQVVVATLPSLQGYEIEEYGYQLLRTWAIGRKGENDGIILIVAPNERAVRIEVGYGLEPVMTDALSSLILQRAVLPAFKAGNYEQGIVAGTREIIKQVGLPPEEAKAGVAQAEARRAAEVRGSDDANPFVVIFSIFVFLWVLSGVMRLFGVRGRRGGLWWLLPVILSNSGRGGGGWSSGGGGGWSSGGGGGGFSGGGGSGGGGGASGRW